MLDIIGDINDAGSIAKLLFWIAEIISIIIRFLCSTLGIVGVILSILLVILIKIGNKK